jgi:hypothetical protein
MPKPIKDRIKRLEENKEFAIHQATEKFERNMRAVYDARIDTLRAIESGQLTGKIKPAEGVKRSLEGAISDGKDRYIFFRTRVYERMGMTQSEASSRAAREYERYRGGFLAAIRGS